MQTLKLTTRVLTPRDKPGIEELVREYVESEALCRHMKLNEEDKRIYVQTLADVGVRGASLGSFDDSTGELCGCGIGSVYPFHATPDTFARYGVASPNFEALIRFDDFMEKEAIHFVGSKNFFLVEIGVVKSRFLKLGISLRIRDRAISLAQEHNCDAIVAIATSEFTAKSLVKRGYFPAKTIYYKDYRDPINGKAVFAGLHPSYQCCTLAVKYLKSIAPKL